MISQFKNELHKLKDKKWIDKKIMQAFLDKVSNENFVGDDYEKK